MYTRCPLKIFYLKLLSNEIYNSSIIIYVFNEHVYLMIYNAVIIYLAKDLFYIVVK